MSMARVIIALALLAAGCGGALEAANDACRQECGRDFMSCIETTSCVDVLTGEVGPCQKECADKRAACDEGCG
jgi:hypothetical protein